MLPVDVQCLYVFLQKESGKRERGRLFWLSDTERLIAFTSLGSEKGIFRVGVHPIPNE